MGNESPSGGGPIDPEVPRLVKTVVKDQVQETLNGPPAYDSSEPLLIGSQAGQGRDAEAQQTTTDPSDNESPPMGSKERFQVSFIIALYFGSFVSHRLLRTQEQIP